jgi:hypothetical protein
MAETRVRRVPVVDPETAARTVWALSRPGGPHCQNAA